MLPHAFLTGSVWDPYVMNKKHKNDEAWVVKLFDPNDMAFQYLVCPFLAVNSQLCAAILGGEEFEDTNLLGVLIIK
jgi:hypothetical protein